MEWGPFPLMTQAANMEQGWGKGVTKTTSGRENHGVTGSERGMPRWGGKGPEGRADRKEGSGPQASACTHVLFWRFCCFLSFNQTVHEKQEEKEEELRPAGTRPQHPCSHSYTHSTGTLTRTGLHRRTHTHQPDTTGHTDTHSHKHTQTHMYRQASWGTVAHTLECTHTSESIQ